MTSDTLNLSGARRIRKGPLRELAAEQIKELILTNQLRPGQSLAIGQLAEYLGVSHTPVREALAMLEREGLVRTPPYGKPVVTRIEPRDVQEVWDMRLVLERAAIEAAVSELSDDTLDEIERKLERARGDAEHGDYRAHYESDVGFHRAIVRSMDNQLFQDLVSQVEDRSIRIRTLVESIANEGDVVSIIDEHIDLLKTIRSRDRSAALDALMSHLEAGKRRTLRALDELRNGES
jgi:DNA-binding GntR family transcriptional regulator